MERRESKGYVSSSLGEPTAERGGRANRVFRIEADGGRALKLGISEPPEDGRANKAVIALLAKAWRLPKSDLAIASGAASRDKTLLLRGDPEALLARLESWLAALAER